MKRTSPSFILALLCGFTIALVVVAGCTYLSIPGLPKSGSSQTPAPAGSQSENAIPANYATFPPSNPVTGSNTGSSQNGSGSQTCDATVNLQTDANNCGGCNWVCPSHSHCQQGLCSCDTGYGNQNNQCVITNSGQSSGSQTCDASVNFQTDANNCGGCNWVCPLHSHCEQGQCMCDTGYGNQNNQCILVDTGQQQVPTTTVTTASSGGICGVRNEGTICQQQGGPDLCVNFKVSKDHCGNCTNQCPPRTSCVNGQCTPTSCSNDLTMCNGNCVSLDFSPILPYNCGGCGQKCPSGNICIYGVCQPLACPSPTHLCADYFCCKAGSDNPCVDKPGYSFCVNECTSIAACTNACKNFQTDVNNCGSCGNVCPQGQSCSAGVCNKPECNIASDCMKPTPPHMEWAACTNHKCVLACTSGWGDCNNKISDGCEVYLTSDASNCGSCGKTCSGTCTNGKCDLVFAVITTVKVLPITPSWKGIWSTSLTQPITMSQNQNSVTGTYINSLGTPGKLSGTLSNNGYTLTGTWIEGSSQGPFEFDLTDLNHFKGWWGNSLSDLASKKSANPSGIWNGNR
jgi:hypothetical protein